MGTGVVGPTIAAGNARAGKGDGGMDARGSGIAEDDANDHQGNHHNGNVEPRDPLCTVTLSDGRRLVLRCCWMDASPLSCRRRGGRSPGRDVKSHPAMTKLLSLITTRDINRITG